MGIETLPNYNNSSFIDTEKTSRLNIDRELDIYTRRVFLQYFSQFSKLGKHYGLFGSEGRVRRVDFTCAGIQEAAVVLDPEILGTKWLAFGWEARQ